MTLDDLKTMADFHYWARDRVLDAAGRLTADEFTRDLGSSFKSVRDTLAHAYAAEWAWYQRWRGTSPTALLPFDQFPDVASLRDAWTELERQVRAFLDSLDAAGGDRVIEYRMLNGTPGSSPIRQMVQHVVNHGSYHRGQVTTLLRQLGAQPGKSMDLIAYYREKSVRG
jgi:uncharacterized damage-inducible protein DinB